MLTRALVCPPPQLLEPLEKGPDFRKVFVVRSTKGGTSCPGSGLKCLAPLETGAANKALVRAGTPRPPLPAPQPSQWTSDSPQHVWAPLKRRLFAVAGIKAASQRPLYVIRSKRKKTQVPLCWEEEPKCAAAAARHVREGVRETSEGLVLESSPAAVPVPGAARS